MGNNKAIMLIQRFDEQTLKQTNNLMSTILGLTAGSLVYFQPSPIGYVASGLFLMGIPFVRTMFHWMIGLEKIKIGNKHLETDLLQLEGVFEKIIEDKDEVIDKFEEMLNRAMALNDKLMKEFYPVKLEIKRKTDVIVTLIEGEKVRIEYEGNKEVLTPVDLGMVDKNKNLTSYWELLKQFCYYDGEIDFGQNHKYDTDKRHKDARHKNLSRFRKRLGKVFGVPVTKSDYHFNNGVFTWETITFRDEFTPYQQKQHRLEEMEMMKENKKARYLKSIKKYDLSTGEQADDGLCPLINLEPNRSNIDESHLGIIDVDNDKHRESDLDEWDDYED